jgi:hypothetical protein
MDTYEAPEILELGEAEDVTLGCCCGGCCDCCCGYYTAVLG